MEIQNKLVESDLTQNRVNIPQFYSQVIINLGENEFL